MKASAVIVAAGTGRRMSHRTPKQFLEVLGKPVLAHALLPFEAVAEVAEEILMVPSGWEEHCRSQIVEKYGLKKVSRILPGGKERQDSVYAGLRATDSRHGIVLVHDGARPLVDAALIRASIQGAVQYGAAVVAVSLGDTLKRAGAEGFVQDTVERKGLWLAQTPQAFRRDILLRAYEEAERRQFRGTDDSSLVERLGVSVRIVEGSARNFKLTTQEDLRLAEFLLQ